MSESPRGKEKDRKEYIRNNTSRGEAACRSEGRLQGEGETSKPKRKDVDDVMDKRERLRERVIKTVCV